MPYVLHSDDNEHDLQEQYEHEHDWLCARCFKTISAARPPVLNLDNCSCAEAGTPANDPSSPAACPLNIGDDQGVPSYPTSDDGSVKTPDGPEARDPNNRFLPVAPPTGLGEVQHRRRASMDEIEEQLSYSVSRWRGAFNPHEQSIHSGILENGAGGWLRQDTKIMAPSDTNRATRGGSGTGSSIVSSIYSGSSSGWRSLEINPVEAAGAWANGAWVGQWPREIDEDAIDDEEYDE